MNDDGSNTTQATAGPNDSGADWHPDGTKIVFKRQMPQGEIFTIKPDGTDEQQLTDNSDNDTYPFWSPDGTKIVFTSTRGENMYREQIYVMDPDGLNQTKITNSSLRYGISRWSPDGTKIIHEKAPSGTWDTDIWVMNADGSNPQQLTDTPGVPEYGPDWKP